MDFLNAVLLTPLSSMWDNPEFLLEVVIGGLLTGVMYSLVALGFVLIYKASGVFNFAQGTMVLFAALTFVGLLERGVPVWAAFILAALTMVVMFPQIIGGAMIVFNPRDLYGFYDLCGRIYPGLGAHYDQSVGGLIVWIPPAMMSIVALLIVLNALRRAEEKQFAAMAASDDPARPVIDSRAWTG